MKKIRVGVIGAGIMGAKHIANIAANKIDGMELAAVCDINRDKLEKVQKQYGSKITVFENYIEMYKSGLIDMVLIAAPHYDHPKMAIDGFAHRLHVLTEKPAGVYVKEVRKMNEAAEKSDKLFGIMYNQRTNPIYQKVYDLVRSGELGEIKRTNWIVTDWYRPQAYHDSGTWRSTWDGEGGGVLINQVPHQLDLWQWICGMPVKVTAFCGFGRYYDIDVDDDVTAFVTYKSGATGVLITSTGEAPGTNRFEIAGSRGRIVVENNEIVFSRLRQDEREFNKTNKIAFNRPEAWECKVPASGENLQHVGILRNFANAVLKGEKLIAPGVEGIKGLTISNAIHLSAWTGREVPIPFDEDMHYELLKQRIESSRQKSKNK
ncbi:MAG: Glucose--fructose oxidoreductase precursor [Firmicutes bacterium ADurb.Bin193]|nr:MAG: Glucose--fructose oxidoreductase precursor [Firmicutes bacterium ADurb.Bin193]